MSFLCYICNKSYINKNSLAAHKSRYHNRNEESLNSVDGQVIPSTFGNYIPSRQDINRKWYQSNQDLSDDSENTEDSEEFKPKIRKIVNEESSDSSEVEKNPL